MHDAAYVLAGLGVGFIVGLTGVGGGSLMTPLLIFFFDLTPSLAVGTDLLFAALTKLGGTLKLARTHGVEWRIVLPLSGASLLTALVTLTILQRLGATSARVQAVMTTTLGVALLLTAAVTFDKALRPRKVGTASAAVEAERPLHWSLPLLVGAVLGALVTLTSVGAGALGVTALMVVYPRLPMARLIAADIAYAVPLTLVAGLGHASLGSVDWALLAKLLVGSLPGIWLGSSLVNRVPDRVARGLVAVVVAFAGLRLMAR